MGIISDLFSIARIRAKMQVRKLQTAEIKGAQIRERIKKEAEILRQQRIDTLKDLKLFEIDIDKLKDQKGELERYLLIAADKAEKAEGKHAELVAADAPASEVGAALKAVEAESFNMTRMNSELTTIEAQLVELEKARKVLEGIVSQLDQQAETFKLQADKAEQVVRLSQTRYRTAQTLLKTNHGRLSPQLLEEIKDIERSAEELTAEAEATRVVYDQENKTDLETIKSQYATADQLSVKERIAKLKAQRAG